MHGYRRHGTIPLFAALSYLDGKPITRTQTSMPTTSGCAPSSGYRETPRDLAPRLAIDNYGTDRWSSLQRWLERHLRFHLHLVPTNTPWLDPVERFFAGINQDVIRECGFPSVRHLVRDIQAYLAIRGLEREAVPVARPRRRHPAEVQRARAALAHAEMGRYMSRATGRYTTRRAPGSGIARRSGRRRTVHPAGVDAPAPSPGRTEARHVARRPSAG
jgi:hypothetical protein